MCAKAISTNGFHMESLAATTEPIIDENSIPTLKAFGEMLGEYIGTSVSILGEDHIRISTPQIVEDSEIRSLREFIANSLFLPVTILREQNYLEIVSI